MASVDQLKRLGAVLPPNFRVESGAVGDVLAAAIALGEYGPDLIAASEKGVQAVHDLFHQRAVKQAQEAGLPEPQQTPTEVSDPGRPPTPVAPNAGVTQSDFDQFKRELIELLAGRTKQSSDADASSPPADAPSEPVATPGTAAPGSTGADQPEQQVGQAGAVQAPSEAGPEITGPFTQPSTNG